MLVTIFLALAITTASVLGRGTRLPVSQQEINDAMRKGTLSQLFRDKVNARTIVLFTGSQCGLSIGSKSLLDQKQPNQTYYYYEYDTQPMGVYFMHESTKAKNSNYPKLPHIWICGKYIGGLPDLRTMQDNGSLAQKLRSCPKP